MSGKQLVGIHSIDNEIFVAGELSLEQLQQASQQGLRSVINLRIPKEKGFLADEPQVVKSLGMEYIHIPVNPSSLSSELVAQIFEQIDQLAKPILMHCSLGLRSAGIALLRTGVKRGITVEEFLQRAEEMGLDFDDRPVVKQFFLDYITQHLDSQGRFDDKHK
ncbi:MAG: protein tyrosine phosphatase family protein [Thermostichus sp. DG02_5_bins_236]